MVNDVVVESGSARHQDLLDRFVRGEEVQDATLRHVWEDTTMPNPVWDRPIYEDFFRAPCRRIWLLCKPTCPLGRFQALH